MADNEQETTERQYMDRMYGAIIDLMNLADSIHRYGDAFPGKPEDDMAMKNARALLDEIDAYKVSRPKADRA